MKVGNVKTDVRFLQDLVDGFWIGVKYALKVLFAALMVIVVVWMLLKLR